MVLIVMFLCIADSLPQDLMCHALRAWQVDKVFCRVVHNERYCTLLFCNWKSPAFVGQ